LEVTYKENARSQRHVKDACDKQPAQGF